MVQTIDDNMEYLYVKYEFNGVVREVPPLVWSVALECLSKRTDPRHSLFHSSLLCFLHSQMFLPVSLLRLLSHLLLFLPLQPTPAHLLPHRCSLATRSCNCITAVCSSSNSASDCAPWFSLSSTFASDLVILALNGKQFIK